MAKPTVEIFEDPRRKIERERRTPPRVVLKVWDCGGVVLRREYLDGARVPSHKPPGRVKGDLGDRSHKSARRAKMTVQCLFMANEEVFSRGWFWTGTFAENVESYDDAVRAWSAFIRVVRRRYPENQYICVPEIQEARADKYGVRVWHFHAVMSGMVWPEGLVWISVKSGKKNKVVVDRRKSDPIALCQLDAVRAEMSDIWNSVNGGDNRCEAQPVRSAKSLSSYVRKYVTKGTLLEVPASRKCYFVSRGVARPIVEAYRIGDDLPSPPLPEDVQGCYSYVAKHVGRITQYQIDL